MTFFHVYAQGVHRRFAPKPIKTLAQAEKRAAALSRVERKGRHYSYEVCEYGPNGGHAARLVARHGVWRRGEKVAS